MDFRPSDGQMQTRALDGALGNVQLALQKAVALKEQSSNVDDIFRIAQESLEAVFSIVQQNVLDPSIHELMKAGKGKDKSSTEKRTSIMRRWEAIRDRFYEVPVEIVLWKSPESRSQRKTVEINLSYNVFALLWFLTSTPGWFTLPQNPHLYLADPSNWIETSASPATLAPLPPQDSLESSLRLHQPMTRQKIFYAIRDRCYIFQTAESLKTYDNIWMIKRRIVLRDTSGAVVWAEQVFSSLDRSRIELKFRTNTTARWEPFRGDLDLLLRKAQGENNHWLIAPTSISNQPAPPSAWWKPFVDTVRNAVGV